jgi:hypothetical protein
VTSADLCESNHSTPINQECGWIRGLIRGVPSEPIETRERIIRVQNEIEANVRLCRLARCLPQMTPRHSDKREHFLTLLQFALRIELLPQHLRPSQAPLIRQAAQSARIRFSAAMLLWVVLSLVCATGEGPILTVPCAPISAEEKI